MSQLESIADEDVVQKQKLEFLSKQLLENRDLQTTNMYGGKGGFGLVLFVEDIKNPLQKYAIKAQNIIDVSTGKINQTILKMCKDEAEMMKNCKHKNVVEIYLDYEIGFYHFIQMKLCQCSLDDWIASNNQNQISDMLFLHYSNQIIDGLEYLHNLDYVLRDLSVRNILLTSEQVVKLCDFGLAKKYNDTLKSKALYTQSAKGVFFYYPPEIYEDISNNKQQIKQTKQGDIWALGVCLSLIGGAKISQYLNTQNHAFQVPQSPNISSSANQLIKFILNRNPQDRPNIEQIREKINELFFSQQNQINIISSKQQREQIDYVKNNSNTNSNNSNTYSNNSNTNSNYSYKDGNEKQSREYFENQLIKRTQLSNNNEKQVSNTSLELDPSQTPTLYSLTNSPNQIERMIDFQFKTARQLLQQYEQLLKIHPNNNDLLVTLGFIEIQCNSNFDKAQQYFNKALQINKDDVDAYIGLGECVLCMRFKEQFQTCIESLKNQLESNSNYWRLNYYLAYFYYLNSDFLNCDQYIKIAFELNQNSPQIISLQALILIDNEKESLEVVKLLEKAHSLNKNNHPDVNFRRGQYEIVVNKDYYQAIHYLKMIKTLGIQQLMVDVRLFQSYSIVKNEKKYNYYKSFLQEKYPNCYIVYEYLGDFEKDKASKINYYEQAVQLYPMNFYCIRQLTQLIDKELISNVISHYQKILEIDPKEIQAYVDIGNIYKNTEQNYDRAFECFNKALQLDPYNVDALQEIAEQFYRENQKQNSLESYYKIIEIDESNEFCYSQIGLIEKELKCHKNSIKAYEKLVEINDTDYLIQKYLAMEYFENEQFQQAIEILKKIILQTQQSNFKNHHDDCYLLLAKAEYGRQNYQASQNYLEQCQQNKNDLNFEARVYFLRCQVRLQKKDYFEKLKTKELIDQFFTNLYNLQNQSLFRDHRVKIEDQHLNNEKYHNKQFILIAAQTLYDFNHYDLSIKFFKKLLELDPNYIEAFNYLGKMEKQKDKKIMNYMKYIQVYQRDIEAIKFLAINSEYPTEQIKYYQMLAQIDPQDIQSLEKIVELYGSENQQQQQLKYIEILLKIDQKNKIGLTHLIEYLIQNDNQELQQQYINDYMIKTNNSLKIAFDMAKTDRISSDKKIKIYLLIQQITPQNKYSLKGLIEEYTILNQKENYIASLEKLIEIDENNSKVIIKLLKLMIDDDCDQSRKDQYFQKYNNIFKQNISIILQQSQKKEYTLLQKLDLNQLILKIEPKNFQALTNLSDLYKELQSYTQQQKCLEQLEEIEPNNQFVLAEFANLFYEKLKDYDKAQNYYEKLMKSAKTNVDVYKNLGDLYLEKKEYEKAQQIFQEYSKTQPTCSYPLIKLGEIYYQQKNNSISNDYYRKADKIDSKNSQIHYSMGVNYYEQKDYKKSLSRLKKCIQQDNNHINSYFMIGDIYLNKTNNKEDSIAYFRKVIEIDSTFEEAHYNLGMAFKDINYHYEAVRAFKELIKLNPDHKNAEQCRDYIKLNENAEAIRYKETSIDKQCRIF